MTVVGRESLDYLDVLDLPPCPRCASPVYEHDTELRAHVCDDCGLYVEDQERLDDF